MEGRYFHLPKIAEKMISKAAAKRQLYKKYSVLVNIKDKSVSKLPKVNSCTEKLSQMMRQDEEYPVVPFDFVHIRGSG